MDSGAIQFSPSDNIDVYRILKVFTDEWRFTIFGHTLDMPGMSLSRVENTERALNWAIDQWNEWTYVTEGRDWVLVFQRHQATEDFITKQGIFITAGDNIIVVHRCVSALAVMGQEKRVIASGPSGEEIEVAGERNVFLHCILSPPHDDTLKVLPVNVVPRVTLFRE